MELSEDVRELLNWSLKALANAAKSEEKALYKCSAHVKTLVDKGGTRLWTRQDANTEHTQATRKPCDGVASWRDGFSVRY